MGLMTAALLLGAGGAAMGVVEARKERKRAEAEMRRNTTLARENAKLDQTKEETGADIVLGDVDAETAGKSKRKAVPRKTVQAQPTVGTTIGGAFAPSIGSSVGLR